MSAEADIPEPWECAGEETMVRPLPEYERLDPECECKDHEEEICATCYGSIGFGETVPKE